MKKTIVIAALVLSFPLSASAHPNLSQFHETTTRPPMTEQSPVNVSVSSGGTGLTPEGIYYRDLEALKNTLARLVELYTQLANLQ